MLEQEQQYLELFNLESAKIRVLRNSQKLEEEERVAQLREQEEIQCLKETTHKMNSIIARASKEAKEEEAQVRTRTLREVGIMHNNVFPSIVF